MLIIVLYILYRLYKNNLPPGPLGNNVPFIGYLAFIDPKKPYETLTSLAKQHGPIYGLQLGSIYCVVLSDTNIIRDAFKREEFTGRAPLYVTHGIMDNCGKFLNYLAKKRFSRSQGHSLLHLVSMKELIIT